MKEQEKNFKPNYEKKLYTLKIDVYENSQTSEVQAHDDYPVKYHEVIGVCETTKHSLMETQREHNRKAYKEYLKKNKK